MESWSSDLGSTPLKVWHAGPKFPGSRLGAWEAYEQGCKQGYMFNINFRQANWDQPTLGASQNYTHLGPQM